MKSRRLGENPLQKLIHTLTIQLNHERRNVIARRVICSVDKSRALKSGLRNNGASEEGYRPAMVKATRVSPLFPRHVPFFRSFNPRERCSPLHGARRVRSLRSHVGINQLERRTARSAGWLTTSGFVSQLGQAATRAYGSPLLARNTATEARAVRDRVRHDRGENRSTRSIDRSIGREQRSLAVARCQPIRRPRRTIVGKRREIKRRCTDARSAKSYLIRRVRNRFLYNARCKTSMRRNPRRWRISKHLEEKNDLIGIARYRDRGSKTGRNAACFLLGRLHPSSPLAKIQFRE